MQKTRILYFDAIKLIAIYLVLYGHCVQHLTDGYEYENPLYIFIYSFHMPLFMIISGYFSVNSYQEGALFFLRKKSINLLLPCITWGIVLYFVRMGFNDEKTFIDMFRHDFWFLKSLFVCYVLTYVGAKLPPPYKVLLLPNYNMFDSDIII